MLTKKQIDSLPLGEYSNGALRKLFGNQHGTPVIERFQVNSNKPSEKAVYRDMQIIGNRFQSRWRRKNPLGELKVKYQPTQHFGNRITAKKQGWLAKFMAFFANIFSRKQG
jgi:hypothetical protein